ncbi:MAG: flagellar protein [Sporomusaceae bacterium]|nr:flagellar protein [Sporomusaceae bacterium]
MELKYCPECGRLFLTNPVGICLECQAAEEPLVDKVREFLRGSKKATIDEIHAATGVKHKVILRMIRSGRVQTDDGVEIFFNCESCGTPIREGRLCDACSRKLSGELMDKLREMQEAKPEPKPELRTGTRMYTREEKTEKK